MKILRPIAEVESVVLPLLLVITGLIMCAGLTPDLLLPGEWSRQQEFLGGLVTFVLADTTWIRAKLGGRL